MFIQHAINAVLPLTVKENWKCLILQVNTLTAELNLIYSHLYPHSKSQTSLCVGRGLHPYSYCRHLSLIEGLTSKTKCLASKKTVHNPTEKKKKYVYFTYTIYYKLKQSFSFTSSSFTKIQLVFD